MSADQAGSIRRLFERPENFSERDTIPTAREKQMQNSAKPSINIIR